METALMPETASAGESTFAPLCLKMAPAVPMSQDQFFDFCQQNRKLRIERTAQGELLIMPPAGGESSQQNLAIGAQLYVWSKRDGTGEAFDSSVGYILPNGANRSPDASWVAKRRLANVSPAQRKKFLPLCPDFAVEILSPSDDLRKTEEKMEEYLANGMQLGWLINPRVLRVHIYRRQQSMQIVETPASLAGDPELPGFVLDMLAVWAP
jgi:Uma2 family endonuclease